MSAVLAAAIVLVGYVCLAFRDDAIETRLAAAVVHLPFIREKVDKKQQ